MSHRVVDTVATVRDRVMPLRFGAGCRALLLLVSFAAHGVRAADAAPQVLELTLHHMMSAMAPAHRVMLTQWAERLRQASGGRLQVRIYPSMQLGGQAAALMDQVRDGIVDLGWTLPGYSPGRYPRIEVFELPFMVASPPVMNRAMHEFIARHPEDFVEVKILNVFVHQGQVLHAKRPIRKADDFRGLKVRVPSRVGGWMVEALGGTPLGSPVQNIPEMLSKGIVDAAYIPYEASFGLKVHELVDHHITLGGPGPDRIQTQIFVLAMNPEAYASLDPSLQAVIDANSGPAISDWLGQLWIEFEQPGAAAARASGELFALEPEEVSIVRERVEQAVIDRWVAAVARRGIDGRALIAEAHALLRKHAGIEAGPAAGPIATEP